MIRLQDSRVVRGGTSTTSFERIEGGKSDVLLATLELVQILAISLAFAQAVNRVQKWTSISLWAIGNTCCFFSST